MCCPQSPNYHWDDGVCISRVHLLQLSYEWYVVVPFCGFAEGDVKVKGDTDIDNLAYFGIRLPEYNIRSVVVDLPWGINDLVPPYLFFSNSCDLLWHSMLFSSGVFFICSNFLVYYLCNFIVSVM